MKINVVGKMVKDIKVKADIDQFTGELLSVVSIATSLAVLIPVDILVTLLGLVHILLGNTQLGIIIIVISNLVAIILCIIAMFVLMIKLE